MWYIRVTSAPATVAGQAITQYTARIQFGSDDWVVYQQVYNSRTTGALGEKIAANADVAENLIGAAFTARLANIMSTNLL